MRAIVIPLEAHKLSVAAAGRPLKRKLLVLGDAGASVSEVVSLLSEISTSPLRYVANTTSSNHEVLLGLVQHHNVTDVVVGWSNKSSGAVPKEMSDTLLTMKFMGIRVHELSAFFERVLGKVLLHEHAAGELVLGTHYHFDRRWQAVKRMVDIAVAVGLLFLTLPLFFVVALAIVVTSSGPVFYRQERVGIGGRIFSIIKFRSMRVDAERDGIPRFATRNDPRITLVGRFLRKTRIDELPQLINVLIGDMSIVGPRPERPAFVEKYRDTVLLYDLRHRVKPGITGWAQVRDNYASSEAETRSKLTRDLYYIKNGSLWMDMAIMVRTVLVMSMCQGSR